MFNSKKLKSKQLLALVMAASVAFSNVPAMSVNAEETAQTQELRNLAREQGVQFVIKDRAGNDVSPSSDHPSSKIFDGEKGTGNYTYSDFGADDTSIYLQVDLGGSKIVKEINLFRYADGRKYDSTVIAVSNDADFTDPTYVWATGDVSVHNLGDIGITPEGIYAEEAGGKKVEVEGEGVECQYVRVYFAGLAEDKNGNEKHDGENRSNHVIELEIMGHDAPVGETPGESEETTAKFNMPTEANATVTVSPEQFTLTESNADTPANQQIQLSDANWGEAGDVKFINWFNQGDTASIEFYAEEPGTYTITTTYRSGRPEGNKNYFKWSGENVEVVDGGEQEVFGGDSLPVKTVDTTIKVLEAGKGTLTLSTNGSEAPQIGQFAIKLAETEEPGEEPGSGENVAVEGVTLSHQNLNYGWLYVYLDEAPEVTIGVNVTPENATNKDVTFEIADTSVATVDENGKIKALKEGQTTLTVTTADGSKTATCTVYVTTRVGEALSTLRTYVNRTKRTEESSFLPENWQKFKEALDHAQELVEKATADISTVTAKDLTDAYDALVAANVVGVPKETLRAKVNEVKGIATDSNKYTVSTWNAYAAALAAAEEFLAGDSVSPNESMTKYLALVDAFDKLEEKQVVAVSDVTLNKTAISLNINEEQQLNATVAPSNASNKNVTWKSSDESVATVAADGKVKGLKAGTATITVTTADGNKTATCTVTVNAPSSDVISVTGIALSETELTLKVGEETSLTATVTPANATNQNVTWGVSQNGVVSCEDGKIVALKEGEGTITVVTEDGAHIAQCKVTVTKADDEGGETPGEGGEGTGTEGEGGEGTGTEGEGGEGTGTEGEGGDEGDNTTEEVKINLTLTNDKLAAQVGQSGTLGYEFSIEAPEGTDVSKYTVAWASSDAKVVSVDATTGAFKVLAAGTAVLTATCGDKSVSCTFTVTDPAAEQAAKDQAAKEEAAKAEAAKLATEKTEVDTVIKGAAGYKASDYTAQTWSAYQSALSKVQELLKDTKTTSSVLAQAKAELQNAINALKKAEVTTPADQTTAHKVGTKKVVKDAEYKVTKAGLTGGEVSFSKYKGKGKSYKIPTTVKIDGITYKVTSVANNAFKNNKTLTKIIVGNNVTAIGNSAFQKCANLTSVTISKSVTKLGKNLFKNSKKLKTISFKSAKVKTVAKKAFAGVTKATKIKVPKKQLKAYQSLFKKAGLAKTVKVTK